MLGGGGGREGGEEGGGREGRRGEAGRQGGEGFLRKEPRLAAPKQSVEEVARVSPAVRLLRYTSLSDLTHTHTHTLTHAVRIDRDTDRLDLLKDTHS